MNTTSNFSPTNYFANLPVGAEYGNELMDRIKKFYRFTSQSGLVDIWGELHRQFFRGMYSLGNVEVYGKARNKRAVNINHFRSSFNQVMAATIQNRPSMKALARNSEQRSINQAKIGNMLLQEVIKKKGYETLYNETSFTAGLYGEGWHWSHWDKFKGDYLGMTEAVPAVEDEEYASKAESLFKGDICGKNYYPWDVVRECTDARPEDTEWVVLREIVNRYDLIARYPKFEQRILNQSWNDTQRFWENWWISHLLTDYDEKREKVPLYILVHKKTPATPKGRYTVFLDSDAILFDGELSCEFPLVIRPDVIHGMPFGYSNTFDALALQKVVDALNSAIVTRQTIFNAPSIAASDKSGIVVEQIFEGYKWIKFKEGSQIPVLLDFLKTPAELFQYAQTLQTMIDMLLGANDVGRGQLPEGHKLSGSALDILDSRALRYQTGFVNSITQFQEKAGMQNIRIFQENASNGFTLTVVGENNRSAVRDFSQKDISDIASVTVEIVNPIYNSFEGKRQMLDYYMKIPGLIKDSRDIVKVLETGRTDSVTEAGQGQLAFLEESKEAMLRGEIPRSLPHQNHYAFAVAALDILNSTNKTTAEDSAAIVAASLVYDREVNLWQTMTPADIALNGCPPPPIPTPMLPANLPPPGQVPGVTAPSETEGVVAGVPMAQK
jgi:hypothetical protein